MTSMQAYQMKSIMKRSRSTIWKWTLNFDNLRIRINLLFIYNKNMKSAKFDD